MKKALIDINMQFINTAINIDLYSAAPTEHTIVKCTINCPG